MKFIVNVIATMVALLFYLFVIGEQDSHAVAQAGLELYSLDWP